MASTSSGEQSEAASLLASLEDYLTTAAPESVPAEIVQRLLRLGVQLYFEKRELGEVFGPFPDEREISATEAMVAAANILEAVDVEVFELGMWKALGTA